MDDGTPSMKRFCFENITAKDCHVAASYFDGLPEQKIEQITMRNVSVSFAGQAKCDVPIMSNGVEACCKKGLYARNVKKLVLDNVSIEGCEGEEIELHNVDEVERQKTAGTLGGQEEESPERIEKCSLEYVYMISKRRRLRSGLPLHMSRDLPADIWRWQR